MRIPVRIADTQKISPTVKSFTLALDGQPFTFLPGQWIDCFAEIDGRTEVAGYSITSSPTEDGWFSIAVKLVGDSAVTDYLHDSAAVGDTLIVEGGQGDFHYTGDDTHTHSPSLQAASESPPSPASSATSTSLRSKSPQPSCTAHPPHPNCSSAKNSRQWQPAIPNSAPTSA